MLRLFGVSNPVPARTTLSRIGHNRRRRVRRAYFATISAVIMLAAGQGLAECVVNGTQYDVGGYPGSGVTAVDRGNPVTLEILKTWTSGDVSRCDVSTLTNLAYAFDGKTTFNQDLSTWDTSNVTNMAGMFYGARGLTSVSLDTSNVTNMGSMFFSACLLYTSDAADE